jgi:hypothetical protein
MRSASGRLPPGCFPEVLPTQFESASVFYTARVSLRMTCLEVALPPPLSHRTHTPDSRQSAEVLVCGGGWGCAVPLLLGSPHSFWARRSTLETETIKYQL